MSHRQTSSSSSPTKGFYLSLQPAQAWTAILALVIFSALSILFGAGSLLRLAFPALSFTVGVFLYRRYPILYLGFTWWLWFLTPLVARLVDYRSGVWDQQRLMLISPFLVTLLTCTTFWRHLPKSYHQGGLPFILAFIGVLYSFLVALIKTSPIAAARALLDWLTPLLFGFHLFVNWRDYPSYRQNLQRTFLWGVFVMGGYGVVQYLVAPEWDRFWLINSGMTSSAGSPEPLKIRVWSTLNGPGAFAGSIVPGLLLLFNSQNTLRLPAAVVGYLAFLLAMVRAAWGGWFVGLLILINSLKSRLQMRLIITILVMVVCVFPLTTIEPFSTTINNRFQSLSNLENDTSYNARSEIYEEALSVALSEVLGQGLGNGGVPDSGILEILFTLGWFGIIPYLGGIVLLLFSLCQCSEVSWDTFINAARASVFGLFAILPMGNTIVALSGLMFWGFSGMVMAAHKYYQHQGSAGFKRHVQPN